MTSPHDASARTVVEVRAGHGRYPVVVGAGARDELAERLAPTVRRVAVVTQAGIGLVVDPGREHEVFTVADGERAKSLATVEQLCRAWSRWGLTRADQVVAVGLVYAAELAHHLGRIDRSRVDDHRRVAAEYGLRTTLPEASDPAVLIDLMARDKKAVDGLTFVLDGPDGVEVVPGVPAADAAAALELMADKP